MWKKSFTEEMLISAQSTFELINASRSGANLTEHRNFISKDAVSRKLSVLGQQSSINVGFCCHDRETADYKYTTDVGREYIFTSAKNTDLSGTPILFIDWNFLIDEQNSNAAHWRSEHTDQINIVWLVDHHHEFKYALNLSRNVDFFCHTHVSHTDYLNSYLNNELGFLPSPALQWPDSILNEYLPGMLLQDRSSALYGGFTAYVDFPRNQFIQKCIDSIPDNKIFMTQWNSHLQGKYFSLSNVERLNDWCSYKCSLVVPVNRDLSTRIFDALLCGQVPIISDDVAGLEQVISPKDQLDLGIVRFKANNITSLQNAYARAVSNFDSQGEAGVIKRSEYLRKNHMINNRFKTLAEFIECQIRNAG